MKSKWTNFDRDAPAVCYLRITTWVGTTVFGAEHWYGRLISGPRKDWKDHSNEVEVEHVLTADEAKRLNEGDEFSTYEAGGTSTRFFHKEDLIAEAVECYRAHFPRAKLLIEGDPTTLEPQLILDGPFDLAVKINSIVDECNVLGWWDHGNDDACEVLCEQWRQIWRNEIQTLAKKGRGQKGEGSKGRRAKRA